jgi:hypothetical protein
MQTNRLEILPRDIAIELLSTLDLKSILNVCKTSVILNERICNSTIFWRKKLQKDYPNIDISKVEKVKDLYFYLKKRPQHTVGNKPEWGDLSENNKAIFGAGGRYYRVVEKNQFNVEFFSSGITFPKFPPEYLQDFGINICILSYQVTKEIAQNIVGNTSFITGPYGEKYIINLRSDNVSSELFSGIINSYKTTTSFSMARFIDGKFYKDFNDIYNVLNKL